MNNRYFGDINDYRKYGLLRHLCGGGALNLGVCWMRTSHEPEEGHGDNIAYLDNRQKYRGFDGELFDCLRSAVIENNGRNIRWIEKSDLLKGTRFFGDELNADNRGAYFDNALNFLHGVGLLFFDPDTGTTIGIKQPGRKELPKYIRQEEIARAYRAGASVLVFQHQRRGRKWVNEIPEIARQLESIDCDIGGVFSFLPSPRHSVFFLVAQKRHLPHIRNRIETLRHRWPKGEIRLANRRVLC